MRAIEQRLRRLEAARPRSVDPRSAALAARMAELSDAELLEIVELCHAPTCANCRFLEERWLCRAAEAPVAADGALAIEDPPAPCAACRRCVERRRAEIIGPIP